MANPNKPDELPIWCSTPIDEIIIQEKQITDEEGNATLQEVTTKQSNIASMPLNEALVGFTQQSALIQQDLNWLFNLVTSNINYLHKVANTPLSYAQADLPAATENEGLIVYVSDINSLARSNGTTWKKITIGGDI